MGSIKGRDTLRESREKPRVRPEYLPDNRRVRTRVHGASVKVGWENGVFVALNLGGKNKSKDKTRART